MSRVLTVRVDKDLRLKVSRGHFYRNSCRCMGCLQIWLGVSSGAVRVMSPDGKREMTFPKS